MFTLNLLGVRSLANSDHFLGETDLVSIGFDHVHLFSRRISLLLLSQVLGKVFINLGGLSHFLNTSALFLGDLGFFLLGNTLTASLQVRALFAIEITTETSSLISEDQMVGLDRHSFTISKNLNTILGRVDRVNSILKLGNIRFLNFLLLFLLKSHFFLLFTIDLDNSLGYTRISGLLRDFNFKLLTINNQLDNLLLLGVLGGKNNSGSGGLFSKDNMFTVVNSIVVMLTIKGLDIAGLNITGRRHRVSSQLLGNCVDKAFLCANGKNLLGIKSDRELINMSFLTISLNTDRKVLAMSINFSFNFIFNFRARLLSLQMVLRHVGKEVQLGSIRSKFNKSVLSNLLRKGELNMD